ncbi:MAG: hypothetical protein IPF54_06720 [Draconibacterium sp.]|nr:hypothetical protein [Draconibacterium sp.]
MNGGNNPVSAVGTITINDFSVLAGDEVTINGQVFTEGAALDWQAGATNVQAATSLLTAITTFADAAYIATRASNVITITAAAGNAGNSITLVYTDSGSGSGIVFSGPTLTGGTDGKKLTKHFIIM